MKKGKDLSAKELAEQLKADSAYQTKLEAQAGRTARVREKEAELLRGFAQLGYSADSLQRLIERNTPLPERLSEALVEALAVTADPALQESLVRALGAAGARFDVQPLVQLFEETKSDSLRWALANTFAELRPLGIRAWLLDALQNPAYGKAREMLALAVARTSPASEGNPVLLALLEVMPGHAALALAESGTVKELRALETHLTSAKGWVKKEIQKAIRAIGHRI